MTDQDKLDIHYAEYLRVKGAIADTAMELNYCSKHEQHKDIAPSFQKDLGLLLERFPLVLGQLVALGVKPATLLLLEIGVKIDLLADSPTVKPKLEETNHDT